MSSLNTFSDGATTSLNSAAAFSSPGLKKWEVQEEGQRPEKAATGMISQSIAFKYSSK